MPADIKNFSFELEHELGAIFLNMSTLKDAEVLIGHLVEDMEKAVHMGEERLFYPEHQRMVRVLWNLIRHTLVDLNLQVDELDKISSAIKQQVLVQEKLNNVQIETRNAV